MREFHAAVHHLRAPDPAVAAQRVQHEVDGDIAADLDAAGALVRARVEAGRRALGGDAATDEAIIGRREQILAAAAVAPAIAEQDVAELRRLAGDLGRAARIRERTAARFTDSLQARVAASTGVAVHPAAVRAAAAAVEDAEQAAQAADAAIAALGADPGEDSSGRPFDDAWEPVDLEDRPRVAAEPSPQPSPREPDTDDLEPRHSRVRAAAVVTGALGAALILVGLDASPVIAAGVGLVGLLLAALELTRSRRAARTETVRAEEAEQQAGHLAAVGAAVAATDSGRRAAALAGPDTRDRWMAARIALDAQRDDAEEQLRVARNRWQQLAGPTADPHDAEAVIQAHDPQLAYTAAAAQMSPTVRSVAAFHRKAQARWKVLWAALGQEQAPDPRQLEAVLDDLLGEHRGAEADARALAEAEARVAAAAEVRRPIVLAEPSAWLTPHQLRQLLASVPPRGRVIVIERERPDADGPATKAGPEDEASEAS